MTILQAILLGLVQGLTEFIPVSSTAHLVFAAASLIFTAAWTRRCKPSKRRRRSPLFNWGRCWRCSLFRARHCEHFARFHRRSSRVDEGRAVDGQPKLSRDAWLGWLVIIGSVPVGIVGLLFKEQIEGPFTKNLWVIATMMVVVGVLMAFAEAVGRRDHDMTRLGIPVMRSPSVRRKCCR